MAADAYTAFSRFGLGARPGDIGRAGADPKALLLAELARPDAALLEGGKLLGSVEALTAYRAFDQMRKANRAAAGADDASGDGTMAMQPETAPGGKTAKKPKGLTAKKASAGGEALRNYTLQVELPDRLSHIVHADTGFLERLVMFWTNHFAIDADNGGVMRALAGPFEREAIRPHILGRFEDLLFAATRHPAMLFYLDNARSVGPDSPAGRKREAGLNENHARELMELHTLGVDGGYTQADVTSLARILTGWTTGRVGKAQDGFGEFVFRPRTHQPGPQTLLGQTYGQKGMQQGEAALRMLAAHPATARHIATKLVRHFVADDPPADIVDRLTGAFTGSDGDLAAVTRALIEDDAVWIAPPTKLRTPQEFVYASLRVLGTTPKPGEVLQALKVLGQPPMEPPSPAGYADDVETWLAPDAMTNRLDVAEMLAADAGDVDPRAIAEDILGTRLGTLTAQAIERAESPAQGLALLLMSPEFQRR